MNGTPSMPKSVLRYVVDKVRVFTDNSDQLALGLTRFLLNKSLSAVNALMSYYLRKPDLDYHRNGWRTVYTF